MMKVYWMVASKPRMLALATMGLIGFSPSHLCGQGGPAIVEVEPIVQWNVAATQQTVGTVMPSRRASIGSAIDGRVTEFYVREGDRVERDQPLAQLLTNTMELELEAAEAELQLRREELAELENGSRPEEILQAKSRMEASRVTAEYLARERDRLQRLKDSSAISLSQIEDIISQAQAAEERLQESSAEYQLAVEGPRPERLAQAAAQVAIQDAVVRRLKDQIKKHTIYSRFAGYVTLEHTEVGQWLPRGELVAEIVALDQVDVLAKVIEKHIPFIQVGDPVNVVVPALSDRQFSGKVQSIVPQADTRSRTFPVKVRVDNRIQEDGEPMLKAGMLARVDLPSERPQTSLMAPKDALVLTGDQKMVWIVDPESIEPGEGDMQIGSAIATPVKTGVEQDDLIEILGDFVEGTPVIVRGNERIQPGPPDAPPPQVTWRSAVPTSLSDPL
jgi:HlyD family secretion protein